MMFSDQVIREIQDHAIAAYPEESCGFVMADGYLPRNNLSPDPLTGFRISPQAWVWAEAKGKILAVVHSHPDGPDCPSASDMRQQSATALPWGIVCTNGTRATVPFWFGDQVDCPDLIGRGFRHGVTDCYAIIRDWYFMERGIRLQDFPRDWEWWREEEDLYQANFRAAGFRRIGEAEVRAGDVFLGQIRSPVPNHGGVYLGGGLAVHHLTGSSPVDPARLSAREPINRWRSFITHWLRYDP